MINKVYLSIAVSFYNSEHKCKTLLNTLSKIEDRGVELVFVNDGSTDNTKELLNNYKSNNPKINVKIISQNNKGLGGARNTGIRESIGQYIWIVDADDDIFLDVMPIIKSNIEKEYDFIDFNHNSADGIINSIYVEQGEYSSTPEIKDILLKNFGRVWTKVFNRNLFEDNNLWFPEYLNFEELIVDYIFPFYIKSFLKSDIVAYNYIEAEDSMTRAKIKPRFFDRMYTSEIGIKNSIPLASEGEKVFLRNLFTWHYLIVTSGKLITDRSFTSWVTTTRVMRQYKKTSKKYKAEFKLEMISFASYKFILMFYLLWLISYLLPSQELYFDKIRLKAWGRKFE